MIPVEDALARVMDQVSPLPLQHVALAEALDLVLAEEVVAEEDLPSFVAAVVDGFAVRAADGYASRRLIGQQMAGHESGLQVAPGTAVRITTGAPMPVGADAVIMVEHADEAEDVVTPQAQQALRPGLGIRPAGSDVAAGITVLAAGTWLGPAELGLLAALGREQVAVHRRPLVGVFSTGDELVEPGRPLGLGQIRDSNRPILLAAVQRAGGLPLDLGIIPDRPEELQARFAEGLRSADVLVTSGGVSMGELDLLKPLLEDWGRVHFGRIRMKPGKPLTFATVPVQPGRSEGTSGVEERLVFGLPGNPVSALVTFSLFVRPAIRRLLGHRAVSLPQLTARLAHPLRLDPERPEYHRVILHREGDVIMATSTGSQASSRLLSVAGANALLFLEQGTGMVPAGASRQALLLDDAFLAQ